MRRKCRRTVRDLAALAAAGEPQVSPGSWTWRGKGPSGADAACVRLGESATSARLLAAWLAWGGVPGTAATLAGRGSLRSRGSAALARLLDLPDPCLPWTLTARPWPGRVELEGVTSSQEISALLLAAAGAGGGEVVVHGPWPSRPYVDLTLDLLTRIGVEWQHDSLDPEQPGAGDRWRIHPYEGRGEYRLALESDASSAAVLLCAGVIAGRALEVAGLPESSRQADLSVQNHLAEAGARTWHRDGVLGAAGPLTSGFDLELRESPDLALPLAAVAGALALGHWGTPRASRLSGLSHLAGKESDRFAGLHGLLTAAGVRVETPQPGTLQLLPGTPRQPGRALPCLGDHRMAFAIALLSLCVPGLTGDDPACVAKSWPGFWSTWSRALDGRGWQGRSRS
ncbi:MAG: hypothetical protein R3E96_04960 [Planctomycetota bacterium]